MVLRIIFTLSVIVFAVIFDKGAKAQCLIEEVQSFNGSYVSWKATGEEYVFSSPACFDGDGKLVVRQCLEKKWIPLKDVLGHCEIVDPEFSVFEGPSGSEKYLYKLSDKEETYNPKKFYDFGKEYTNFKVEVKYWSVEKPIGKFYDAFDVSPGHRFGYYFSGTKRCPKDRCYVINKGPLYIEECKNKNYIIFIMGDDFHIDQRNCPSNSGVFLNQQDVCFGQMHLNIGSSVSPKLFTTNLYQMQSLFRHFSYTNLFLYDGATVPGLDVRIDTKKTIPFQVITRSNNHNYLKFSKIKKEKVEIILNVKSEVIEVKCINCNLLWTDDSSYPGFTCFTDAGAKYLTSLTPHKTSHSTYSIDLHREPGMAHYWCSGYTIFDTELVESNKVLAGKNSQDFQEFLFYVKVNVGSKTNIEQFDEEIRRAFLLSNQSGNSFIEPIKHIRTFEILDELEPVVTVVCHIVTDTNATESEVYYLVKNKLKQPC